MEHILILFFSFFIESMITWLYTGNLFLSKRSALSRVLMLGTLYFLLFLLLAGYAIKPAFAGGRPPEKHGFTKKISVKQSCCTALYPESGCRISVRQVF